MRWTRGRRGLQRPERRHQFPITDLIFWRQDVGWPRLDRRRDPVAQSAAKSWSHLRSAVVTAAADSSATRATRRRPNRAQTDARRESDASTKSTPKTCKNDSLFWGIWIDNMFDYGSSRRPYGVNGARLVTLNRRECKDAYYLYKAMWEPRNRRCTSWTNGAGCATTTCRLSRLLVGRGARADCGKRHAGRDRIRPCSSTGRIRWPCTDGRGESPGGRAARQRDYSCRQRFKTETDAGPSANSRSANDKLGRRASARKRPGNRARRRTPGPLDRWAAGRGRPSGIDIGFERAGIGTFASEHTASRSSRL